MGGSHGSQPLRSVLTGKAALCAAAARAAARAGAPARGAPAIAAPKRVTRSTSRAAVLDFMDASVPDGRRSGSDRGQEKGTLRALEKAGADDLAGGVEVVSFVEEPAGVGGNERVQVFHHPVLPEECVGSHHARRGRRADDLARIVD